MMCVCAGRCLQPPAVGECDALFPSFFFNSSSGACEHFNYGGCGGNQNRFTTRESCLTGCAPDGELATLHHHYIMMWYCLQLYRTGVR